LYRALKDKPRPGRVKSEDELKKAAEAANEDEAVAIEFSKFLDRRAKRTGRQSEMVLADPSKWCPNHDREEENEGKVSRHKPTVVDQLGVRAERKLLECLKKFSQSTTLLHQTYFGPHSLTQPRPRLWRLTTRPKPTLSSSTTDLDLSATRPNLIPPSTNP